MNYDRFYRTVLSIVADYTELLSVNCLVGPFRCFATDCLRRHILLFFMLMRSCRFHKLLFDELSGLTRWSVTGCCRSDGLLRIVQSTVTIDLTICYTLFSHLSRLVGWSVEDCNGPDHDNDNDDDEKKKKKKKKKEEEEEEKKKKKKNRTERSK